MQLVAFKGFMLAQASWITICYNYRVLQKVFLYNYKILFSKFYWLQCFLFIKSNFKLESLFSTFLKQSKSHLTCMLKFW